MGRFSSLLTKDADAAAKNFVEDDALCISLWISDCASDGEADLIDPLMSATSSLLVDGPVEVPQLRISGQPRGFKD